MPAATVKYTVLTDHVLNAGDGVDCVDAGRGNEAAVVFVIGHNTGCERYDVGGAVTGHTYADGWSHRKSIDVGHTNRKRVLPIECSLNTIVLRKTSIAEPIRCGMIIRVAATLIVGVVARAQRCAHPTTALNRGITVDVSLVRHLIVVLCFYVAEQMRSVITDAKIGGVNHTAHLFGADLINVQHDDSIRSDALAILPETSTP